MAGASVTKSVACPHCGKHIDKTKIQARNAGLFCDDCAAGMRAETAKQVERQCPACARPIGEDDVLCQGCGFDYRIGYSPKAVAAQTAVGANKKECPNCGYDCTAMAEGLKCPECGEWLRIGKVKGKTLEQEFEEFKSRRQQWKEMVKPTLIALGTIAVLPAYMIVTSRPQVVGWTLERLAERWVILFGIVAVSMFSWLEIEHTWKQIAVRLLAVTALGYLADQILWDTVGPFIAYPLATIVFVALFMSFFDIELNDSIILTLINWFLMFMILYVIVPRVIAAFSVAPAAGAAPGGAS